jgi:uncharacterized protein
MIIDIIRLKNNIDKTIDIDIDYSFSKELLEQAELLELNNVLITGFIKKDALGELFISLTIKGVMVLPCAITLKPVNHPFEASIDGNIEQILSEMGENFNKGSNSLDILPIIWENVLMEIPLRVVSEDAKNISLKGDGWELITEEEDADIINPELAKLKDLL